jgi:hypothetical protein
MVAVASRKTGQAQRRRATSEQPESSPIDILRLTAPINQYPHLLITHFQISTLVSLYLPSLKKNQDIEENGRKTSKRIQ